MKKIQDDLLAIYDLFGKVAEYVYDAWGNCKVLNPNGTENTDPNFAGNVNPIRYRSYYYDVDIGLYYLQTRYYDPETGRFINLDQIEYIAPEQLNGLNLYAYCLNNPVMNVDPAGTWSWQGFGMILAASLVVLATAAAVAITAGAAAVAIAGAAGLGTLTSASVGLAVGATALTSGVIVGGGEIANQVINKGSENINLGSVALSTAGASLDGAMIAGSAFGGPIGKLSLYAGRIISSVLTTSFYGMSEGLNVAIIRENIFKNATATALAGLITFKPSNATIFNCITQSFTTGAIKLIITSSKIINNLFVKLVG